jgi:hypothetical protein
MNTRKLLVKLVALACCGAVSGVAMATTQEEIDKQVSNMIGTAIGTRVATAAPKGASADNGAYAGITNVSVSFAGTKTSANAYYGGVDHNFTKDLIGGAAAFYSSYTGTRSTGLDPYLAYVLNSNFYLLGKVNIAQTTGVGTKTETLGSDISINGFVKSGDWLNKGSLGIGQSSAKAKYTTAVVAAPLAIPPQPAIAAGTTITTSSTMYAVAGETNYTFAPTWLAIGGVNWNSTNRANTATTTASLGLEKEVAKDAAVGLKYTTNIGDNALSGTGLRVKVITLSGRFRF